MIEGHAHVLVPIVRSQAAAPLTDIGDALVAHTGGYGRVLALAELPPSGTPDVRAVMTERRRSLLQWISATDSRRTGAHRARAPIEIRVSADILQGIREAAFEQECDLLVVEWPGLSAKRPHLLERVVEQLTADPPADLVLVRPDLERAESGLQLRRVLLPMRGGANARLALLVAEALCAAHRSDLTVLHVYSAAHSQARRERERADVIRVLETSTGAVPLELRETVAARAGPVILSAAESYDAVVMGAFGDSGRARALVRSSLVDTVRRLHGTVVVVKTAERRS